ncbi:MAG: putative membrane protein [Psychromonas sp.]|jgi:putative membrane protein|uniref:LapA family protein n=1 Tax=Psychromonas sp. TaxID=1884585 RepID=UPI0039E2D58E
MKRFLTLIVTVLLFAVALVLGLKNQQIINVNYLLAQGEMRLSTLLAIVFMAGFLVSAVFAILFYLKLKITNRQLRKLNKQQSKEINQLRTIAIIEKD